MGERPKGFDEEVESTNQVENFCPVCERMYPSSVARCVDDNAMLVPISAQDPLQGRVLDGRYRLDKQLGSGGMGAVYIGEQTSISRQVAIKLIHTRLGDNRDITKRFFREARLASKLNHPNTVSIIDFGRTDDGLLYLVMELVAGATLAELLKENGPFSPLRVIEVGRQIASALGEAHAAGIIHRDLKPANVMVSEGDDALVKVLDFGIAKSVAGDEMTQLTQTDAAIGTPTYMAPEVVRGTGVDARTDLYAVGLVLYELLAGRIPFDLDDSPSDAPTADGKSGKQDPLAILGQRHVAIKLAFCHAEVEPNALPSTVPPSLAAVVMRLLRKDPDDRFASAVELRHALDEAELDIVQGASDLGTMSAPRSFASAPRALERTVTGSNGVMAAVAPPPTNRWRTAAIASAAVLAAAGAVAYMFTAEPSGAPGASSSRASAAKTPSVVPAPAATAQGASDEPAGEKIDDAVEREDPAPTPVPAEPERVVLRFESTPTADVYVDGKLVGATPYRLETPVSSEAVQVKYVKDGYETVVRSITPGRDRDVVVVLSKVAVPAQAKPRVRSRRAGKNKRRRRNPGDTGAAEKKKARAGNSSVDPFAQ